MSQANLNINNGNTSNVLASINAANAALGTLSSGTTAPPNPIQGQVWFDTGSSPNVLKIYEGGVWKLANLGNKGEPGKDGSSTTVIADGTTIAGDGTSSDKLRVVNPVTAADVTKLRNLDPDALSVVSTDSTIDGDGKNTPLSVANPFTSADKNKLDSLENSTGSEAVATALNALEQKTHDLVAGSPSTGWSNSTSGSQGGLAVKSGSAYTLSTAQSATYSIAPSSPAGKFFAVRVPAGTATSQARLQLVANDGITVNIGLSSLTKLGSTAVWDWYGYSRELGTNLSSVRLQLTGSSAHTGSSTFEGNLTQENVYEQDKKIFKAGSNITITPNDSNDELTIASTASGGGSSFDSSTLDSKTADLTAGDGTAGSTSYAGNLAEGKVYDKAKDILVAGSNITLTEDDSTHQITITATNRRGTGITAVVSDSSLKGTGVSGSPLGVVNPLTAAEKTKLSGVEAGATAGVVSDGTLSGKGVAGDTLRVTNPYTTAEKNKLAGLSTTGLLSEVESDSTLKGDGTSSDVLGVADNAIASPKLANNAVTNSKLSNNAVSTAKIQNSAITTGKVANKAITQGKLADTVNERLLPAPTDDSNDSGKVPALTSDGTAYELVTPAAGGTGGGGISSVRTGSTITGDGNNTPLDVANPFTAADETKLDAALTEVVTDSTISGTGVTGDALGVAIPYTQAEKDKLAKSTNGAEVLHALGVVEDKVIDLTPGPPSDLWADATNVASQAGLAVQSGGAFTLSQAENATYALSPASPGGKYLAARVLKSIDARRVRVELDSTSGTTFTLQLSSFHVLGSDADYTYYAENLELGSYVASMKVQLTGVVAHVGTSTFSGNLDRAKVYNQTKAIILAGNNVTVTPDDSAGTLTVASTATGGGTPGTTTAGSAPVVYSTEMKAPSGGSSSLSTTWADLAFADTPLLEIGSFSKSNTELTIGKAGTYLIAAQVETDTTSAANVDSGVEIATRIGRKLKSDSSVVYTQPAKTFSDHGLNSTVTSTALMTLAKGDILTLQCRISESRRSVSILINYAQSRFNVTLQGGKGDPGPAGSGMGGGISTVNSDSTLTGDGSSSDPLKVANPLTESQLNNIKKLNFEGFGLGAATDTTLKGQGFDLFGNVSTPLGLSDSSLARLLPAPTDDTDDAGKIAALNSDADAWVLIDPPSGGGGNFTLTKKAVYDQLKTILKTGRGTDLEFVDSSNTLRYFLEEDSITSQFLDDSLEERLLPAPTDSSSDSGKLAALNSAGSAYELVSPSTASVSNGSVTVAKLGPDVTPRLLADPTDSASDAKKVMALSADGSTWQLQAQSGSATDVKPLNQRLEALEAKASDLSAGKDATGWANATTRAQGGINSNSSSRNLTQVRGLGNNQWRSSLTSGIGQYLFARIPASGNASQYQVRFVSGQGDQIDLGLSSFSLLGSDSNWKYYAETHVLGSDIASLTLRVTGSAAHIGTSSFGGNLVKDKVVSALGSGGIDTSLLKNDAITLGKLADEVVKRLLPSTLGTAGQVLQVNSGRTGTEYATPSAVGSGGGNYKVIHTFQQTFGVNNLFTGNSDSNSFSLAWPTFTNLSIGDLVTWFHSFEGSVITTRNDILFPHVNFTTTSFRGMSPPSPWHPQVAYNSGYDSQIDISFANSSGTRYWGGEFRDIKRASFSISTGRRVVDMQVSKFSGSVSNYSKTGVSSSVRSSTFKMVTRLVKVVF